MSEKCRPSLRVALRNKFMRRVLVEEMVKGAEAVVRCQLADGANALGLGSLRVPVPTFLFTAFGGGDGGGDLLTGVSLAPEVSARDRDVAANTTYLVTYLAARLGEGGAWAAFGEDAAAAATAVSQAASGTTATAGTRATTTSSSRDAAAAAAAAAAASSSVPGPGQALAWWGLYTSKSSRDP